MRGVTSWRVRRYFQDVCTNGTEPVSFGITYGKTRIDNTRTIIRYEG